ncbi:MAG TPA: hypothetical protein VGG61_07585 [Gemmataceae bacterium]|jgi:hypothetical protein
MPKTVEIENIEDMRLREGIDDVELRQKIRGLRIGDSVYLTFRAGAASSTGETLSVRITSIRGSAFRGKLAKAPASPGLTALQIGSSIAFTTEQIHSLPKAPARAPQGNSC